VGRPKAQGTLFGKRLERLKIIKEIYETYPEIVLFTVHDSIIYPKSYEDRVELIFNKHFQNLIRIF